MTLTQAILCVLLACDKPMTSYEVYQALPEVNRMVHSSDVKCLLKSMARRGKVRRIAVNEKHGQNWVKSRYCLKE